LKLNLNNESKLCSSIEVDDAIIFIQIKLNYVAEYGIILWILRIMNLIDSLDLFVRIVERGGLAAAGRDLGLSPAMVTERLAALENHYRARLLNRTTRSISLTDEGRLLFDGAKQLVGDAADIQARIQLGVHRISGHIRLSAPIDLGRNLISQLLDQFIQTHPNISVELLLNDGYVDLAGQGIDLAVRLGDLKDSSLHAVRLGNNRRVVCAAPSYLQQHTAPNKPQDLLEHNCLLMRFGTGIDREWGFNAAGKASTVIVNGNRISNDGSLVRHWCTLGHGIALKSYWDIKQDLAQGHLQELLSDYARPPSSIHVVYQGGKSIPKRVRTLIDALVDGFSKMD
jgi:DNA-binding transcriptional LysR family regulator